MIKDKKAQNEMVGFIVIVVIVVIIGLFLLVLYLRQDNPKIESKNAQNFLRASMLYTTSCSTSDAEPLDIEEVIKSCYKNKDCSDGKDACVALNETYSKLLEDSWKGSNTLNSYSLLIYYTEESNLSKESNISDEIILNLKKGQKCNGTEVGSEEFIYYDSGSIISEIKMCYR